MAEVERRCQARDAEAERLARQRARQRAAFVAYLRESGQNQRADRIEAIHDTTGAVR